MFLKGIANPSFNLLKSLLFKLFFLLGICEEVIICTMWFCMLVQVDFPFLYVLKSSNWLNEGFDPNGFIIFCMYRGDSQ